MFKHCPFKTEGDLDYEALIDTFQKSLFRMNIIRACFAK